MGTITDFGNLELGRPATEATASDWAKAYETATGRSVGEATWETPEGIAVPPLFAPEHLADGHLTLVPALRDALAGLDADDVLVVGGGVIPPDDVPTLEEMGAAAVFPPGTVIADAAQDLLATLSQRLRHP